MLSNNPRIEEIFSLAWEQVRDGRSVEAVVADYPEYATEIEPMLRLTRAVLGISGPTLSTNALSTIQRRAEAAAQERRSSISTAKRENTPGEAVPHSARQSHSSWLSDILSALRTNTRIVVPTLIIIAVLLVGTLLLRSTTTTPQARLESYSGVITQISSQGWQVGETDVIVDIQTKIHGQPIVGAMMICIGENLPGKDRMHAKEVWINMEPSPPLTVPTRSHDEDSIRVGQESY